MTSSLPSPSASRVSARLAAYLFVMLLIAAATTFGQTDSSSVTGAPKRFSVRGSVVNSVSGEPIARALVNLAGQSEQMTLTDSSGSFHFEGVPEGRIFLGAERPGFLPLDTRGQSSSIAGDVDGILVPLAPQAVINGCVASVQNVPIEDATVRLYRRVYLNGRARWQTANLTTSDDAGQFRFGNLEPGSYSLSVAPENWRMRAPSAKPRGYPQVFYPSAPDQSSASVLTVSAGQQVEADFSLMQQPLFEVSGEVAGVPPGMEPGIQLTTAAGDPIPIRIYPEHHGFSTYAPAGRYTLKAFVSNESPALQGAVPLTVAGNTAGVQVALGPRPSIPVTIHTDDNSNPAALGNLSIVLMPSANSSNIPQLWARPATGRRGGLEIDGAEATTYTLEITAYGKYVVSATSGSTDLLHDDLAVPADGRAEPIEITLGIDGGEITGSVHFSSRAGSAIVLLVPEHASAGQVKSTNAGPGGEFQFQQVRPGSYLLVAIAGGGDFEYQNPDVLDKYLSSATHITVSPKQQVNATLEAISPEK